MISDNSVRLNKCVRHYGRHRIEAQGKCIAGRRQAAASLASESRTHTYIGNSSVYQVRMRRVDPVRIWVWACTSAAIAVLLHRLGTESRWLL
jgi:hypothetical protein